MWVENLWLGILKPPFFIEQKEKYVFSCSIHLEKIYIIATLPNKRFVICTVRSPLSGINYAKLAFDALCDNNFIINDVFAKKFQDLAKSEEENYLSNKYRKRNGG